MVRSSIGTRHASGHYAPPGRSWCGRRIGKGASLSQGAVAPVATRSGPPVTSPSLPLPAPPDRIPAADAQGEVRALPQASASRPGFSWRRVRSRSRTPGVADQPTLCIWVCSWACRQTGHASCLLRAPAPPSIRKSPNRDVHHQAKREHDGERAGAAVADERQGHADHGQKATGFSTIFALVSFSVHPIQLGT